MAFLCLSAKRLPKIRKKSHKSNGISPWTWLNSPILQICRFSLKIGTYAYNKARHMCSLIKFSLRGRVLVELFHCLILYLLVHSGPSNGFDQCYRCSICVRSFNGFNIGIFSASWKNWGALSVGFLPRCQCFGDIAFILREFDWWLHRDLRVITKLTSPATCRVDWAWVGPKWVSARWINAARQA